MTFRDSVVSRNFLFGVGGKERRRDGWRKGERRKRKKREGWRDDKKEERHVKE